MSETPHVEELLGAFLDEALSSSERRTVAEHLRQCDACREELEQLRSLQTQLQRSEVPDPGPAYWRHFAARVEARLAASPADRAITRPGWIQRSLAGFRPNGPPRWGRLLGATAMLVLLCWVGIRSFGTHSSRIQAPLVSRELEGSASTLRKPAGGPPALPSSAEERAVTEGMAKSADAPREPVATLVPAPGKTSSDTPSSPSKVALSPVRSGAAATVPDDLPDLATSADEAAQVGQEAPNLTPVSIHPAAPATRKELASAETEERRFEVEMPLRREDTEETARRFVAAALTSDVPAARAERDELQRLASPETLQVHDMDTWLRAQGQSTSSPSARLQTARPPEDSTERTLLALDRLVWPRRDAPDWSDLVGELARRLVEAAPGSDALRQRALAYAEYLARTSKDETSRAAWQEQLERLRP